MKKKIIAFLCAMVMLVAASVPVFANDTLYGNFKNASISEIRDLFFNNYGEFTISTNGITYSNTDKVMIILDAWQKDFNSFAELDENVTASAAKLATEKAKAADSANRIGLTAKSSVMVDASKISQTSPDNVFKFGGKEFILLDTVVENGEKMYFVMGKDIYGAPAVDPNRLGRWTDTVTTLLPYRLTYTMAAGKTDGSLINATLPTGIMEHVDVFHIWHTEPGLGAGFTTETMLVAPISIISATEFIKYADKIGKGDSYTYWTRTSLNGQSGQQHFIINNSTLAATGNSSWNGHKLRPVFYLGESFFKEEKLQSAGINVAMEIDSLLTASQVSSLYDEDDLKEVFGSYSVSTEEVTGDAVVGKTLRASYTYSGVLPAPTVAITWEKSEDMSEWDVISGATGATYQIQSADAGYYIRAVFTPTFDSKIFKNGEVTYAETTSKVYTDQAIRDAVKMVNDATTIEDVREALETHYALFNLEYMGGDFPDEAVLIFMNDEVRTVDDVVLLYNSAIALYEFNTATSADIKEKAESEYLLGSIPEYEKLATEGQKAHVITLLSDLPNDKVSQFLTDAIELIMLERFNNATRSNIVSLILEHYTDLEINIAGLSNYQYEIIGAYIVGNTYDDVDALKEAAEKGLKEAKKAPKPSTPIEDTTEEDNTDDGFTLPVTNKPGISNDVIVDLFNDLQNVPWAVIAINSLARDGILSGVSNGVFDPNRPVTRNEFVKMIVNAFDIEVNGGDLNFEDIDNNSWSAPYIKAAIDAGIITGISDTKFGNGMNITRQDVAVIADRVMTYSGVKMPAGTVNFNDNGEISDYAFDSVGKLKSAGIMSGMSGNIFAPKNSTTRAQAAVVVYNLLNYYNGQVGDGTISMRPTADKYEIVFDLGIMKEEYISDGVITRAELAAIIVTYGNLNISSYDTGYGDVPSNHKYAREIESVTRNNIMAPGEEGKFLPDREVTYGELYDAIIAATGYKEFPGGTFEADKALSKEPIYAQRGEKITPDQVKKVLFAALEIPLFEFIDAKNYRISENVIMNKNFSTYKDRGRVNAVSGVSLGGRKELEDNQMIITVDGKDYLYYVDGDDFSQYLGYNVTYYYTKLEDTFQVIWMTENNTSEDAVVRLSFEQITDAENDLSSINYEKGNRIKTANIARSAEFVYNGRRCYNVTRSDLFPNNGYITLVDTNGDKTYDVVNIENYEYIMVAQVDSSYNSILDRFTWKTFGFEEEKDAEKVNITKNGRYIRMEYLNPGDVLAIAKSRDGKLIKAYVSDVKVIGRVNEMSASDYEIVVDGNRMTTVRNFDFANVETGMNITIGVDWNGYAVGYYTDILNSDVVYGYVYDVYAKRSNATLYMLTQDNTYAELQTSAKFKLNDENAEPRDLGSFTPQLVAYTLDGDGNVKKLYTAQEPIGNNESQSVPLVHSKTFLSTATGEDKSPVVVYNNFGMTLGFKYNFPKKAVMFEIVIDGDEFDKDSSRVSTAGAQIMSQNEHPEKVIIYNADMSRVSNLFVYEHAPKGGNTGYSESFNSQAFIVEKARMVYDENKDTYVPAYTGYHAGSKVTYRLSDKFAEGFDGSKIKAGDVLLIWLENSQITKFRRMFTFSEADKYLDETDVMCNYGDHTYTGGSINYPVTGWSGTDIAQRIFETAEGKSSSTNVAGTRMASIYGDVQLVYKGDGYTNTVITFIVAGTTTPVSYMLDSSSKVYIYNKTEKTITAIEGSSVNFANKKAVVTTRYGNVRDVVIYED